MEYHIILQFTNPENEKHFLGPMNRNLDLLKSELDIEIFHNNSMLMVVAGLDIEKIKILDNIASTIHTLIERDIKLQERDIIYITLIFKASTDMIQTKETVLNFYYHKKTIVYTYDGRKITVKTLMQQLYLDAIENSSITFATGPAGSGKTYLAVCYAISCLKKNLVKRLIITRPVVEAGEKLGFLPGDLREKIDPYLIPIYDALHEILGKETTDKMIEKGIIEIAPLAYMRGRTLDNAIIILDEAQNTTSGQMKMFVTRLGFNSQMIINGDMTQVDLLSSQKSGLIEAIRILDGISGIKLINLTTSDVMRHPLVGKIVARYEENQSDKNKY